MHKRYLALVTRGNVGSRAGAAATSPLLREQRHTGERMVRTHSEGKPSLTRLRALRRSAMIASLVAWSQPRTGRTHQIRVHAAELLDMPLAGDAKYGDYAFNRLMRSHTA